MRPTGFAGCVFTRLEQQTIYLVSLGIGGKEVAARMGVGFGTHKQRIYRIYRKLERIGAKVGPDTGEKVLSPSALTRWWIENMECKATATTIAATPSSTALRSSSRS
jgi:hypothetical protein